MTNAANEYPCQTCHQRVRDGEFHPHLYCVLYMAGIAKQEKYLRDSGFRRVVPRKPAPPFTRRARSKAIR